MLTAEQARTLACTGFPSHETALTALGHLERQHGIDCPKLARRLVGRACAIHEQMLHAKTLQMISAKGRRLDRLPLDPGDYASGSYRLAVALANGLRAVDRKVLGVSFRPEAPTSLYEGAPWILEHVGPHSLAEISLDIEGQKRELSEEFLPMSEWSPENLGYQRLLRQCSEALERVEWLAKRPQQHLDQETES